MLVTHEDGYYALTTVGLILTIAVVVILILLTAFISTGADKGEKKRLFTTKQLVFSSVAIAIAFAASFIKLIHMPWGGSVTLFSMLFVTLIGYWYGPRIGLVSAFAYGLLQFVQGGGSYILSPMQLLLDYLLAFTALGLSGFFREKKNGLIVGYIVSIAVRAVIHSIGGYLYWMDYMPENFPKALAAIYPVAYNFSYIGVEGIITCIILAIPAVREGLKRLRTMAVN